MINNQHRTILILTIIIALICLPLSCTFDNMNYPRRLYFDKEGGTSIIPQNANTISIGIFDNGEEVTRMEYTKDDSEYTIKYKWLTVMQLESELEITVLPNDTGKTRKLDLDIMVLDLRATVSIIQR